MLALDRDLMKTYLDSVMTLRSPDLVCVLDVAKRDVKALQRTEFEHGLRVSLREDEAGDNVVLKQVERPAALATKVLNGPLAFWLVATFPDGKVVCAAMGTHGVEAESLVVSGPGEVPPSRSHRPTA